VRITCIQEKNDLTFQKLHFQNARSSSSGLGISSGYSGLVGRTDTKSMVEAKYPAVRFKQQLTAYVEKIYGLIRDSLKKEISAILTMCIQVPQASPNLCIIQYDISNGCQSL
jgi:hypothetical protein